MTRRKACRHSIFSTCNNTHKEKVYATTASKDFHLFYLGRDDVHSILKYVLSRVSASLYLNMFGYDDEELNDILMTLA
jgi:hypothetical protein